MPHAGYNRRYSLKQTSAPATNPITTDEAKDHARITISSEDTLIDTYIAAATRLFETYIGRQLVTATWRMKMEAFPAWTILVPRPPFASVTSLAYVDTAGDAQTLTLTTDYVIDTDAEPGTIEPAFDQSWPTTRTQTGAVTITYVAGYGAAASVPDLFKTAIKELVVHWFEQRNLFLTGTIGKKIELMWDSIVDSEQVVEFA